MVSTDRAWVLQLWRTEQLIGQPDHVVAVHPIAGLDAETLQLWMEEPVFLSNVVTVLMET
ncbi:hypothetical protein F7725_010825 [Dissostichus mawsoni]|uniref:Uncharacterized protein n=1 Tax=Dissostichus mawsoni TaxID=36200 RepID=A0A7J5Z747_DISMA|nr:hypothetical protein F7725_010825 [Dissostichus mawsoni]